MNSILLFSAKWACFLFLLFLCVCDKDFHKNVCFESISAFYMLKFPATFYVHSLLTWAHYQSVGHSVVYLSVFFFLFCMPVYICNVVSWENWVVLSSFIQCRCLHDIQTTEQWMVTWFCSAPFGQILRASTPDPILWTVHTNVHEHCSYPVTSKHVHYIGKKEGEV